MLTEVLWSEKYRPRDLSAVALSSENRALLEGYLGAGEIPHLLFFGGPGTGKTTTAKIINDSINCTTLTLNASAERGIDVIRDRVGTFARVKTMTIYNHVFLDEADRLTPDAQTALRNMMETYAERTRFILTANYLHKIIDPIRSRCVPIELAEMPFKERMRILATILRTENIEFEPTALADFVGRYSDMRRLIMAAQASTQRNGGKLIASEDTTASGAEILEKIRKADYAGLVQLSRSQGFDHTEALKALFWALPDDWPRVAERRAHVAHAVHESGFTPDPVVHFLGTCSELLA